MAQCFIGLSGYSYKPWQGEGRFYPAELKPKDFLAYYSTRYPAVEMDGSWYRTPTEEMVAAYVAGTPDHFRFSFKMHRKVTHLGRLKPETYELVPFFLNRLQPLARVGKLGPMQVQLPPNLRRDDARLHDFLQAIPKEFESGERVQWSVEFRHESWSCAEVEAILREFGVAWIASDRDEARAEIRNTADGFAYVRLRRADTDAAALDRWAGTFQQMVAAGKDTYVYCKHEDDGSPWVWADALLAAIH